MSAWKWCDGVMMKSESANRFCMQHRNSYQQTTCDRCDGSFFVGLFIYVFTGCYDMLSNNLVQQVILYGSDLVGPMVCWRISMKEMIGEPVKSEWPGPGSRLVITDHRKLIMRRHMDDYSKISEESRNQIKVVISVGFADSPNMISWSSRYRDQTLASKPWWMIDPWRECHERRAAQLNKREDDKHELEYQRDQCEQSVCLSLVNTNIDSSSDEDNERCEM